MLPPASVLQVVTPVSVLELSVLQGHARVIVDIVVVVVASSLQNESEFVQSVFYIFCLFCIEINHSI